MYYVLCFAELERFVTTKFYSITDRFGSRIDEQNGGARKSFARKGARWIMSVELAEMGAQTTTPETERPEAMAVRMWATRTPSARPCRPRQGYL